MFSGQEGAADKEESFMTSSMKSVIKALSGTNSGPLTSTTDAEAIDRNRQSNSSAEEVTELDSRDLRGEFARLKDDASESNGIVGFQAQKPNSDTLISLLPDCNADVSNNGIGSRNPEGSFPPALRSLFGGLSHHAEENCPHPVYSQTHDAAREGGMYGSHRYQPSYPVQRMGEPFVNFTSQTVVSSLQPRLRESYGSFSAVPSSSHPRVRESFVPSPPQTVISSFHPGQTGVYGRDGASEMGFSTRLGRDDARNDTQRDNKRPKERTRDQAYKKRFSMDPSEGITVESPIETKI